MLIKIDDHFRRLGLSSGAVVHVGAHEAEERKLYLDLNLVPRIWIEAQPKLAAALSIKLHPPDDQILQGAAWSEVGMTFDFNVSSNSQSSSVLEFGTHSQNYPDIEYVKTVKVHSIVLEDVLSDLKSVTLLNLDIQGAELQALRGAGRALEKVKAIYTEVNFEEVYKDCALIAELDAYLREFGFKRVLTFQTKDGWGDALYLHNNYRHRFSPRIWATRNKFRFIWFLESYSPRLMNLITTRREP
jgi:FkbM family methyltransferase